MRGVDFDGDGRDDLVWVPPVAGGEAEINVSFFDGDRELPSNPTKRRCDLLVLLGDEEPLLRPATVGYGFEPRDVFRGIGAPLQRLALAGPR